MSFFFWTYIFTEPSFDQATFSTKFTENSVPNFGRDLVILKRFPAVKTFRSATETFYSLEIKTPRVSEIPVFLQKIRTRLIPPNSKNSNNQLLSAGHTEN